MTKAKERYIEKENRRIHCKKWLIDRDLTQRDAAGILGVGETFLSAFINGRDWSSRVAEYFNYKREA